MKYTIDENQEPHCDVCGSRLTQLETQGDYCFECDQTKKDDLMHSVKDIGLPQYQNSHEFERSILHQIELKGEDEVLELDSLKLIVKHFREDLLSMFVKLKIEIPTGKTDSAKLIRLQHDYPQEFFLLQCHAVRNVHERMKNYLEKSNS